MQIWVDGDACPNAIKEILFRASDRTHTTITFVSNKVIYLPNSPYIKKIIVSAGFDVADNKIIESVAAGDLVITADIPLANGVIDKGGFALNPRGKLYTKNNIKEYLAMRNFSEDLRSSGVITSGPAKLNAKEIQIFANSLDKFLTSHSLRG